jgi:hypothetical protein
MCNDPPDTTPFFTYIYWLEHAAMSQTRVARIERGKNAKEILGKPVNIHQQADIQRKDCHVIAITIISTKRSIFLKT